MKDIEKIAQEYGLTVIETTSERNGYPSKIQKALIGFEDYFNAQYVAIRYELKIQFFTKKTGWKLWYRTGETAHEEMKLNAGNFNADEVIQTTEEEFFNEEIKPRLNSFHTLDEVKTFIENMEEIWEELENADEVTEMVLTKERRYYQTVDRQTMNYEHDTNHTAIGLIF